MVYLTEKTWVLSCSSSSLITWILEQSIPSASCGGQNRKKWVIPLQRVMLLSSGTLTGWRNGLKGTSCCSARRSAKSSTWEQPPHASIHAGGHPAGKQLYRKEPGGCGRLQIEYEAAVHPYVRKANGVLSCIRQCGQQVRGDGPATLLSTDEAISGVLCPVLGCPVQKRYRAISEKSAKD